MKSRTRGQLQCASFFVTNGYPTDRNPEFCIFNKEQIESIQQTGVEGELLFINAYEEGPESRRRAAGVDIIHCFHGLTFLTARIARPGVTLVVSFLNAIENAFRDLPEPMSSGLSGATEWLLRSRRTGAIFKDRVLRFLESDPLACNSPNGVNIDCFVPMDRQHVIGELDLDPSRRYIPFVSSKSQQRRQKAL